MKHFHHTKTFPKLFRSTGTKLKFLGRKGTKLQYSIRSRSKLQLFGTLVGCWCHTDVTASSPASLFSGDFSDNYLTNFDLRWWSKNSEKYIFGILKTRPFQWCTQKRIWRQKKLTQNREIRKNSLDTKRGSDTGCCHWKTLLFNTRT